MGDPRKSADLALYRIGNEGPAWKILRTVCGLALIRQPMPARAVMLNSRSRGGRGVNQVLPGSNSMVSRSVVGVGLRCAQTRQSMRTIAESYRKQTGTSPSWRCQSRRGLGPPASRPVRLQLLFEIEHLLENDRVLVGTSVQ